MARTICNIFTYMHNSSMTKSKAIEMFGSVKLLADALGIGIHAIYMWPNEGELNQRATDQVMGAALRLDMLKLKAKDVA